MCANGVSCNTSPMGIWMTHPVSLPNSKGSARTNRNAPLTSRPTRKALSVKRAGSRPPFAPPSVNSRGTRASGNISRSTSTHWRLRMAHRQTTATDISTRKTDHRASGPSQRCHGTRPPSEPS